MNFSDCLNRYSPTCQNLLVKCLSEFNLVSRPLARAIVLTPPHLTEEQLDILLAFFSADRAMLLNGGPGTGKTTLIARLIILSLLKNLQDNHQPIHVLASNRRTIRLLIEQIKSCSREAAGSSDEQFISKLNRFILKKSLNGGLFTVHGFCYRFLSKIITPKKIACYAGNLPTFNHLLLPDDVERLAVQISRENSPELRVEKVPQYLNRLEFFRNRLFSPREALSRATTDLEYQTARFYQLYTQSKLNSQSFDFTDLLYYTVNLLRHDRDLRKRFTDQSGYFFVDDIENFNRLQLILLSIISGPEKQLLATGDCYCWSDFLGEDKVRTTEQFKLLYPQSKIYNLSFNYRSRGLLCLSLADLLPAREARFDYAASWPYRRRTRGRLDYGLGPGVFAAEDGREERYFLLKQFERLFKNKAFPAEQILVVLRTNSLIKKVARMLRDEVPVQEIYRRDENSQHLFNIIRSGIFLALMLPDDNRSVPDCPAGIEAVFCFLIDDLIDDYEQQKLLTRAATDGDLWKKLVYFRQLPVDLTVEAKLQIENLIDWLYGLKKLSIYRSPELLIELLIEGLNLSCDRELLSQKRGLKNRLKELLSKDEIKTPRDFLRALNGSQILDRSAAESPIKSGKIVLASPGVVRGREFEVVFIPYFEEGIWPFTAQGKNSEELSLMQARREFYRAAGRAREELLISYALRRKYETGYQWCEKSRLLSCYSDEFVDRRKISLSWAAWFDKICTRFGRCFKI